LPTQFTHVSYYFTRKNNISLSFINRLDFVMEIQCVFCEVGIFVCLVIEIKFIFQKISGI
jgi:hypothetical protein